MQRGVDGTEESEVERKSQGHAAASRRWCATSGECLLQFVVDVCLNCMCLLLYLAKHRWRKDRSSLISNDGWAAMLIDYDVRVLSSARALSTAASDVVLCGGPDVVLCAVCGLVNCSHDQGLTVAWVQQAAAIAAC